MSAQRANPHAALGGRPGGNGCRDPTGEVAAHGSEVTYPDTQLVGGRYGAQVRASDHFSDPRIRASQPATLPVGYFCGQNWLSGLPAARAWEGSIFLCHKLYVCAWQGVPVRQTESHWLLAVSDPVKLQVLQAGLVAPVSWHLRQSLAR